jgi:hypothetical protein
MDIGLLRSKLPECPFANLPEKKSGSGAGADSGQDEGMPVVNACTRQTV